MADAVKVGKKYRLSVKLALFCCCFEAQLTLVQGAE